MIFSVISIYLSQIYLIKTLPQLLQMFSCLWGAAAKSVVLLAAALSIDVLNGPEEQRGYFLACVFKQAAKMF